MFQITASLLQPLIGLFTDRRPAPLRAAVRDGLFTLLGLVLLAFSRSYPMLLVSVALIGVGSAVFHPEASRAARAASGGRHGFAQSLFQVGGNFGQSLGPLMAAFIVVPGGQISVLAFTALALHGDPAARARRAMADRASRRRKGVGAAARASRLPRAVVWRSIGILVVLLFSKMFYLASLKSYYTFYLIQTFDVSVQTCAGAAVRLPRRGGGGHFRRRTDRRPVRAQIRDLGVDPRRAAVHAAAAASRSGRDGDRLASRSA